MASIVSFVASNPDTTRLVLSYAWIVIPVAATLITFLVRLCSCCIFGLRDNSYTSCCGGASADVENARCTHIHHHHGGTGDEKKSDGISAVKYDYVGPGSDRQQYHMGRYRYAQALICCAGFICAILAILLFAALFPFLESLAKAESV
jgi:hypothetical protein